MDRTIYEYSADDRAIYCQGEITGTCDLKLRIEWIHVQISAQNEQDGEYTYTREARGDPDGKSPSVTGTAGTTGMIQMVSRWDDDGVV